MADRYVSNDRLDELIEKYSDMVYRIAVLRCRNKHDADDIFQEVFVKLVRHAAELETDEHVKAWLIRVTINQCNSFLKSSWNEKVDHLEDFVVEPVINPEEEESEMKYLIVEALRYLKPPEDRDIIYLFYYEEYSVKEIAQILGKSETNIKVTLNRARKKLKKALEEKGVTPDGRIQE